MKETTKLSIGVIATAIVIPFLVLLLVGQISELIEISWWWFVPLVPFYFIMLAGFGVSTSIMLISLMGVIRGWLKEQTEKYQNKIDKMR